MKIYKTLIFLLIWQMLCPASLLAQAVAPAPWAGTSQVAQARSAPTAPNATSSRATAASLNLDLGCSSRSIQAGTAMPKGTQGPVPVQLVTGGTTRPVSPSDLLTAAEFVALSQIISTGRQTLALNAAGTAVGGSFALNAALSQAISALVIPQGVIMTHNFGTSPALNLRADLANAGTFYAFSSNSAVTTASIAAANITNAGLLTTILPNLTILGVTSALPTLDLALSAASNITNTGIISSSGNLNLTAGGSIANSPAAILQAANAINLASQSGRFTNNGFIVAGTGDINFGTGQMARDIVINNLGGTIQAPNGSVNVRERLFSGSANTTLSGGNWMSRQLNVYSGTGAVAIDTGDIRGTLNVSAGKLGLKADSSNLTIGKLCVDGDPVLINSGNVDIGSLAPVNGATYVIVAGGSITDAGQSSIDTSSGSGSGGNVMLVAGANNITSAFDGTATSIGANTAGASGGSIILSSNSSTTPAIDTESTASDGSGGNVTLIAFAGSDTSSGRISVTNTAGQTAIRTNGSGTGTNGNVTIIAGGTGEANTGFSIAIGDIITGSTSRAGSGGNGRVLISTAMPNVYASPVIVGVASDGSAGSGAILSGSFEGGAPVDSAISVGSITTSGGNVLLYAGSNAAGITARAISAGSIQTNPISGTGGVVALMTGIAGTSKTGVAGYNIDITGIIGTGSSSVQGGTVLISAVDSIAHAGIESFGAPILLLAGTPQTNGAIGSAGDIDSSSTISDAGKVMLISLGGTDIQGTGAAGNIDDGSGSGFNIYARSEASGRSGGSVAVSSARGVLSFADIDTSTMSGSGTNAGDILLTTGASPAANLDTITATTLSASSANSAGHAGQIWAITANPNAHANFIDATQNRGTVAEAEPVKAVIAPAAIGPGTTQITFRRSDLTASPAQSGSASGYSAGGFTGISDSSGAVDLKMSIINTSSTTIDTDSLIPLISTGAFTLSNSSSIIEIPSSSSGGTPNLAFFAPGPITIGNSSNAVSLKTNGHGTLGIAAIASGAGGVTITNSASAQNLSIGLMTVNGNFTLTSGGTIGISGSQNVSGLYSLTSAAGGIQFGASVFATGGISAAVSDSYAITQSAGLLDTRALSLNAATGLYNSYHPYITTAVDVSIITTRDAYLTLLNSASVSATGHGMNNLTAAVTARFGLLTVGSAGILANGTVTLQAQAGSEAGLDIKGDIRGFQGDTCFGCLNIPQGPYVTDTILLTADGNGGITESTGTGALYGSHVTLSAGVKGSIGTSSHSVRVFAETLNLSAPDNTNGRAFISSINHPSSADFNPADRTVFGSVSIGNSLQFTAEASLKASTFQTISVPNVTLITTSGWLSPSIIIDAGLAARDSITLKAQHTGSGIAESTGGGYVLTAPTVALIADITIGSSDNRILTQAAALTVVTNSAGTTLTGSNNIIDGTVGDAWLSNTGVLTLLPSSTGGGFTLTNSDSLTVNSLSTRNGSILLKTMGGRLSVADDSVISATGGTLALQNTNIQAGTISIEKNVSITDFMPAQGYGIINVFLGNAPTLTNPNLPMNVAIISPATGKVFFGAKGIAAAAPAGYIRARGQNAQVAFDTGGAPASSITLGGNDLFSTGPTFASLDLTNLEVVKVIKTAQSAGSIGGALVLDPYQGGAIGGTVALTAFDIAPRISALNIPGNVTVTLSNLPNQYRIDIDTTLGKQITLEGALQFNGSSASSAVVKITARQDQIAFTQWSTGSISTNGALEIITSGAMDVSGRINGPVTLRTTNAANGNITAAGTFTSVSGPIALLAAGDLTTTGGINQNTRPNGGVSLSAGGTLTSSSAISAYSGVVQLTSNGALTCSGNINSYGSLLQLTGSNITASGKINAYTGNVVFNASSGSIDISGGTVNANGAGIEGNLQFTAAGNITVNSAMTTSNKIFLETIGNDGSIALNAAVLANHGLTATTTGTGTFSISANKYLNAPYGPVSIAAAGVVISGGINAGSNTITINPNSPTQLINIGSDVAGAFNMPATALKQLSAGTITIGSMSQSGGIAVCAPVSVSSPNLTFMTGGDYSAAGQTLSMGARVLSVTASGEVATGTITGAQSVNITAGTGLTVSGNISASNGVVNLTTTDDGDISWGTAVIGGTSVTTTLGAGGSGRLAGTGTISGTTIRLSSGTGAIGAAGSPVSINGANLTASTGGSVNISSSVPLTLAGASSAGGTDGFTLTAASNITVGRGATVTVAGGNPLILAAAGITGSISQIAAGITLIGKAISITSGTGSLASIGSLIVPIGVNSGIAGIPVQLAVNAGGGIYISGNSTASGSGAISIAKPSAAGTQLRLNAAGPIELGANTLSARGSMVLTATGAGSMITQSGAFPGPASLMSPSIVLSAGADIGSGPGSPVVVANVAGNNNPVNLTITGGGNVFAAGSSIALTGTSTAGGSSGFQLVATGGISLSYGALVNSNTGIALTAGAGGSITQPAGALSLIAPAISLNASTGSVGTLTAPVCVNSGVKGRPVSLTAVAANDLFIKGVASGAISGAIRLSGASSAGTANAFNLNAAGPIVLASGATVIAGTATLTASAAGAGISQDSLADTTIFASQVVFNAAGTTSSIGTSAANPIIIAQTSSDTPGQTLTVNANATGSVFIRAANTGFQADIVNVNMVGNSSAAGGAQSLFSLSACGDITLIGSATNLAKIFNTSGTIALTAGNGRSISQAAAGTVLTAASFYLSAGTGGIGTSATSMLGVSAGNLIANTTGSAFITSAGTVTLNGASGAGGAFVLSATGLQSSLPASSIAVSAPAVTLNIGLTGVGSAAQALQVATQVGGNPVNLRVNTTGSTYISGLFPSSGVTADPAGLIVTSSSSAGSFNLSVQGDLSIVNGLASTGAVTVRTTAAGSSAGNISGTVQSTSVSSPLTLTALAAGGAVIRSLSPVNLSRISGASTNGFTLYAGGAISFMSGAQVVDTASGGFVNISTTNNGSIWQAAAGLTVVGPSVILSTSGGTNTSTIGSVYVPITVSSGNPAPVSLTVNSGTGIFISTALYQLQAGSGDLLMSGNSALSNAATAGQMKITANGAISIGALATVASPGTLTLTSAQSSGSITQTDLPAVTTLFAPTMVLTAGTGGIGSSTNAIAFGTSRTGTNAHTVNLTVNAGGDVYLSALNSAAAPPVVNVVMAGTSRVTGTGTLNLTSNGSITQALGGLTIVAPAVNLTAASNIGTSAAVPLGINSGLLSGNATVPVNLTAVAGTNVFVAGITSGTVSGAVNLVGTSVAPTQFNLSGSGAITQTGTATTIFSPVVTLSTSGNAASIGLSGAPITSAGAQSTSAQIVKVIAGSTKGSVYLNAMNSASPTTLVEMDLAGSCTAGGTAATFTAIATGNVKLLNDTANNGKITDTSGTVNLTAGTGGSITQAVAGTVPVVTGMTVNLTADTGGTAGTIGTPGTSPINFVVSAATLNLSAGNNVYVNDTTAAKVNAVSQSGAVRLSVAVGLTFVGASSAATGFSATTPGAIALGATGSPAVSGSIAAGTTLSLSGSGLTQVDAQTTNDIAAPTVSLNIGATGVGTLGHAIGIASQVASNAVSLAVVSTGAAYIYGNSGATTSSGLVMSNSSSGSIFSLTMQGELTQAAGATFKAATYNLWASGSINLTLQNPTISYPITLTANSGSNTTINSLSALSLSGGSGAGASSTVGFTLSCAGNLVFNAGASITATTGAAAVALTTSNKGSIWQQGIATATAPAISIISPNISLAADPTTPGTQSTIGLSTRAPMIINSGQAGIPVMLTALSNSNTYISVPNATVNSTQVAGNVVLTGRNYVSSSTTTSQFYLNVGGSISQSAASGITTIFAPTIALTAGTGAGIGTTNNAITFGARQTGTASQTVNLSINAGGEVYLDALNSAATNPVVNVVMSGTSNVTGSGTFNLTSNGSITQALAGLTLVAPTVNLTAAGNIGNSVTLSLGINSGKLSGTATVPVNLTAVAGTNVFVAGITTGTVLGAVNLVGTSVAPTQFKLSGSGDITQTGAATTVFSPVVTLSTTGTGTSIGSSAAPITFAADQSTTAQTVKVNANSSSGSVYLYAVNSMAPSAAVELDFVGSSTATGAQSRFTASAAGDIKLVNDTTNNGKITDASGAIFLLAGNISQTAGGTPLTASVISLSGITGGVGSVSIPLNVATSVLAVSCLNDLLVNNSLVLNSLTANSAKGAASVTNTAGVNFNGSSSSMDAFTLVANGPVTFLTGSSITSGDLISLNSGTSPYGGFSQKAASITSSLIAPAIKLTAGGTGIGSADHAVGIASQVAAPQGVPASVNLQVSSGGAVFIYGNFPSGGSDDSAGFVIDNSTSTGAFTLRVQGDILVPDAVVLKSSTAMNLTALPAGAGAPGNITQMYSSGGALLSPAFFLSASGSIDACVQSSQQPATSTVNLTATAAGDVSLSAYGAVNLIGTSGSGALASTGFILSAAGNVVVSGAINSTTSVSLKATGAGNISNSASGAIGGPAVLLNSTNGSIGTSAMPLHLTTGAATANALNGGVFLSNTGNLGLTINQSASGGPFSVKDASGSLTVAGSITVSSNTASNIAKTSNSLTLIETAGPLSINEDMIVYGGSILIQAASTIAGQISFADGVQVSTLVSAATPVSNGTVTVAVGPVPAMPVNPITGTFHDTIQVNNVAPGGQTYAGAHPNAIVGPVSGGGSASVTAKRRNVIFSSPTDDRTITLGANVSIEADPPLSGVVVVPAGAIEQGAKVVAPGELAGNSLPMQESSHRDGAATNSAPSAGAAANDSYNRFQPVRQPHVEPILVGPARDGSVPVTGVGEQSEEIQLLDSKLLRGGNTFVFERALPSDRMGYENRRSSDLQPISYVLAGGPRISQHERNTLVLNRGGAVLAPDRAIVVSTPDVIVNIAAGAVVLVCTTANGSAVFNLHDRRQGDVTISIGGQKSAIRLGAHFMVAHIGACAYEDINPVPLIAHAGLQARDLPSGVRVFRSRFSISSALAGVGALCELKHSPDPQQRTLHAQLVKNAAILMQTGTSSGGYRQMGNQKSVVAVQQ